MNILTLLTGLFMIATGFMVKRFPNLIAGYNTMSAEKKKNIDIEGLSTHMRNGFIAIGLSMIAGYYAFTWLGLPLLADSMIIVATLVGLAILLVQARKYDHTARE